ncbi:hypothetical protein ACFE04_006873 [Oxalis oulophora]
MSESLEMVIAATEMAKSPRQPCFYHVFSSNFTSHKLKIPSSFVKHMDGHNSGLVWLEGPSGCLWRVGFLRQDTHFYFHTGWSVFVQDNSLVTDDLLVFRYDGHFHFSVQVFDQSSRCEKEASFQAVCTQGPTPTTFNKYAAGLKREWDNVTNASSLDTIFDGVPKKSRGTYHDCVPDDNTDSSILKRLEDCLSTFSEHEEKKVAESFTSCYPFFVRKMKRFNVNGSYTLNVPYKFSMAHLPNCKTEISLHNKKGACWIVNSVPTIRVHTSHTFCGGWLSFVRDNDIKMGDICIFELINTSELHVHILRVGKEEPESQNAKVTSQKLFDGKSKKMASNSPKVHYKSMAKVLTSNKNVSKKNPKISSNGKLGKDSPLVASQRRNDIEEDVMKMNPMVLARAEEKAAKSFISTFPNFVRIMRKFNTSGSYTLKMYDKIKRIDRGNLWTRVSKVPHQFSTAYLPNRKTEITLHNTQGECWTVNSVPDSRGRVTHTICGGWMAFVRGNDIRMGDICMFELVSQSDMRVQISGPGRKTPDNQLSESSTTGQSLLPGM